MSRLRWDGPWALVEELAHHFDATMAAMAAAGAFVVIMFLSLLVYGCSVCVQMIRRREQRQYSSVEHAKEVSQSDLHTDPGADDFVMSDEIDNDVESDALSSEDTDMASEHMDVETRADAKDALCI